MKIHNTLTRQTEDFNPIKPDEVKLYTCGPTVYDFAHIGNLRSFVFDDTLRRTLQTGGYKVKHVMNITDVGHLSDDADQGDDKLENGAQRESKSVWEVADFYINAFVKDMTALNVLPPNGYSSDKGPYARATDFISEQLEIVQILMDKGFAYQTDHAIYFDVTKLDDYGKLTGQKLADKEVAARPQVVVDKDKKTPQDFALWFFKVGRFAEHSMSWPSAWGDGFPGWHLECSAIIHATLGEPLDIHTGGVDHIGTHHTNEIAQTEAAFGVKLANYWMHNEHLLVDGHKMSKSSGNYFTLKDVSDRGFDPLALRLLFLQSHYRTQSNFTWESIEAAANFLTKLNAWADLVLQSHNNLDSETESRIIDDVRAAMANDLNSPQALAVISEAMGSQAPTSKLLSDLDEIFGLKLSGRADINSEQKVLLNQRQAARDSQDWQKADQIREGLKSSGLEVLDTDSGQIWSRV